MYEQITANKRKTYLIVLIFVGFILFLGWLFGELQNWGNGGLAAALLISFVMALFGYYSGDKVALAASGAQPMALQNSPTVYRIVENLCIASGQPMPKIYIIQDGAPNAFATGRDPKHASIAVTTGLLEIMSKEELEGVIAHEISHVRNYDIRVMTIIIVLAGAVALISDWFLRSMWSGSRRNREEKESSSNAVLLIIGLVLAILSPIIGKLIQLAVSRKREFLADASGALLTRYPEGLASALQKIQAYPLPMIHANNATAHLYISNPFGRTKTFLSGLFSTHPPLQDRIDILRKMI